MVSDAPVRVAAVVTNYNYEQYVAQAVESLLRQHRPFDEIIVVDDGSTDNSLATLRRFQGRIALIRKENGGHLSACLAGLRACTSPYVYFMDADDLAEPTLLQTVYGHLTSGPAKVQFQLTGIGDRREPLGSTFPAFPPQYDAMQMRSDNVKDGFYICPPTSGNVFSRSALERCRLDSLDPAEHIDGVAAMLMPYLGNVVTINQPLAQYRVHGANMSIPTPRELGVSISSELARFEERWRAATRILEAVAPPLDPSRTTYVTERRLMLAAHRGEGPVARSSYLFVRSVLRSSAPPRQKGLMLAWAIALLVPWPARRRQLVELRRFSSARPKVVASIVKLAQRPPRRAQDASL